MIIPPPAVVALARRTGLAATILCACCGVATAALSYEDEFDDVDWGDVPQAINLNDLRFGMALLPGNSEITTQSNGQTSYDRQSVFESTGRTSLMWMMPVGKLDEDGGFVAGLEASRNRFRMSGSRYQPDIDSRCWVGSVHLGLGWMLSNSVHLETTAYAGYGTASFASGKYGTYWEYGARAGLFYTFKSGLQFGLHVSYLDVRMTQTYVENRITYDVVVLDHGGYGGLMIGLRL